MKMLDAEIIFLIKNCHHAIFWPTKKMCIPICYCMILYSLFQHCFQKYKVSYLITDTCRQGTVNIEGHFVHVQFVQWLTFFTYTQLQTHVHIKFLIYGNTLHDILVMQQYVVRFSHLIP